MIDFEGGQNMKMAHVCLSDSMLGGLHEDSSVAPAEDMEILNLQTSRVLFLLR